jgi:hypothetical protein
MGRIQQTVRFENAIDKWSGSVQVRQIEITMLVDSGAAMACLPAHEIGKLGLPYKKTVRAVTADGIRERRIYAAANICIGDRDGTFDVMEIPDQMGYVIDLSQDKLIENPDHNGKLTLDLL